MRAAGPRDRGLGGAQRRERLRGQPFPDTWQRIRGTVQADIAWGGMFYVIADASQFGLTLTPDEGREILALKPR